MNFNDITPAPPAGTVNVKWQKDGSGNVSANVSSSVTGYNPAVITDPYADVRSFGVDCTGVADSRAALLSAFTSGKNIKAPTGCKIKIQASGGVGLVVTGIEGLPNGWLDIDGNGAEIFGCGAGAGAVVKLDRSGYFRFHGFNIQLTDFTLCGAGSTFTRPLDWTNNGGGGVTSTKAEFDHLRLTAQGMFSGGNWWPNLAGAGMTAADGNQVAYADVNSLWQNLGIHQETATTITNGTLYTLNVKVAVPNITWDNGFRTAGAAATANITANGVVVATQSCTVALTTWNTCTVNYTGIAGTAGQTLGVTLLNTSTVTVGGAQSGFGQWTRIFFDNITTTNFTVANPSFETLPGGAVLSGANANITPTPGDQWTWVQGAAAFPQFIGFQVGGFSGDQNLEGMNFHDSDIDGFGMPNSLGFFDQGCCSDHVLLDNIYFVNMWRGAVGAAGGVIKNAHGGGPNEAYSNYQQFGVAGGALIAPTGCAGGRLTVISPTWNGYGRMFGPFGPGACTEASLYDAQITAPLAMASGEYVVDGWNIMSLNLFGGLANNMSGVALPNTSNAFVGSTNGNTYATAVGVDLYQNLLGGAVLFATLPNLFYTEISTANTGTVSGAGLKTTGQVVALPQARPNGALNNPSPAYQWMTSMFASGASQTDSFAAGSVSRQNSHLSSTLAFNYTPAPSYLADAATNAMYAFDKPFSGLQIGGIQGTPGTPVIIGGSGATSYSYKVVGRGTTGTTGASAAGSTATGPATLDATHCNLVVFTEANAGLGAGAWGYDIYRTVGGATQGKITTQGVIALALTGVANGNGQYAYSDCGAVGDGTTAPTLNTTGVISFAAVTFANLGTPANGTFAYCSDCTVASPCAGGGTGALAKRLNGVWVCN